MMGRRLFAVVLLGSMVVSLAAAEEEKRPARVAPEQVLLTLPSDNEAVEFCTALGEVKAKSGILITDDNGHRISEHDYFPFGVEATPLRQETLPVNGFNREEPMKFTGHERDFNIGTSSENSNYLDYMHARSTVPQWGRFLSVDPVLGKPAQSQSWNRYAYVQNNPINRTDPSGKCGESSNFVGPTKPCMEVVKNVVDKAAFLVAKSALTVMVGFYNYSPKQVASGTAQLIVAGAVGGAVSPLTKPALAAASSTSLMSRSSIALNLGGEGEVAGASVVNVMGGNTAMAVRSAVGLARSTGQSVVVASGDALPFQTGAMNTVITNNVPINAGMTYLASHSPAARYTASFRLSVSGSEVQYHDATVCVQ